MTLLLQEGVQGRPVYRWTIERYLRAIEAGDFPADYKAELIDGIIIEKMPIGTPHSFATRTLRSRFERSLGSTYVVGSQEPILLPTSSRPEPDLWLATPPPTRYATRDPGPEDLALVVEVADSSFDFDQETKLPVYAAARIPEYWIVDIPRRRLLRFADPDGVEAYAKTEEYAADQTLDHPTFGRVAVAELFAD